MVNGGFAYGYLFMSQHQNTPNVFAEFLADLKPSRILEIGTFHGGLTLLLRDIMDNIGLQDNTILTYDVDEQEFLKPLVKDRNVDVRTKNLFDYNNNSFINNEAKEELQSFIQSDGISLVLCDGGCKRCEYNIIAPLLKVGDIIMAHDYAPNEEYFEKYIKNKIWDWMEINDNDINNIEGFDFFYQHTMQQIAWLCRIKI